MKAGDHITAYEPPTANSLSAQNQSVAGAYGRLHTQEVGSSSLSAPTSFQQDAGPSGPADLPPKQSRRSQTAYKPSTDDSRSDADGVCVTWTRDSFTTADGRLRGRIYQRGRSWCLYYTAPGDSRRRVTLKANCRESAKQRADALFYTLLSGSQDPTKTQSSRMLKPGSIATKGAIAEYVVMADLMSHGFEVYRAASPNSSCDLVVLAANRTLRVEVKCGKWERSDGQVQLPPISNSEQFDVLAVYSRDRNAVLYRPPIDRALEMQPTCFREMVTTGKVPRLTGASPAQLERKEKRTSWINSIARGPSKYFPEENQ